MKMGGGDGKGIGYECQVGLSEYFYVSLSRDFFVDFFLNQIVKHIEKIPHVRTAVESSIYALRK